MVFGFYDNGMEQADDKKGAYADDKSRQMILVKKIHKRSVVRKEKTVEERLAVIFSAPLPLVVYMEERKSPYCFSGQIGISFLMLCSNEISVSVAVTPGISCILLFSKSIRCSLSRAYTLVSMV